MGANAVGTEVLKNLVLPGCGSLTIVDGETVRPADLGSSFFVSEAGLGEPRARVTAELLQELNEDANVSGWVAESVGPLLDSQPEFFSKFTMVVAAEVEQQQLLQLADKCWKSGVALVAVRTSGFLGTLRVCLPELCVVESKPDNAREDLRVVRPFAALSELAGTFDIDTADSTAHAHTPWVVILLKCLAEWRAQNGGGDALPKGGAQKKAFKALVRAHANNDKGPETNFLEAVEKASNAFVDDSQPNSTVRAILDDAKCTTLGADSSAFWVAVRALRDFVQEKGTLPLRGSIPDMTADTTSYIALQRVYQAEAAAHVAELHARTQALASEAGVTALVLEQLSEEYVRLLCKNAHCLRVERFSSLEHEYTDPKAMDEALSGPISMNYDKSREHAFWYLALRGAAAFQAENGRHASGAADQAALRAQVDKLCPGVSAFAQMESDESAQASTLIDACCTEICRCAGSQMHCTAALLGGLASQEVIKVITQQFTPVKGVFLMNTIDGSSSRIDV